MAKSFQMYKHDLDGQGDHSNPTQFYDKHLVSGLDPALCTSGGGWLSLHSLVSLTRCYRHRDIPERKREKRPRARAILMPHPLTTLWNLSTARGYHITADICFPERRMETSDWTRDDFLKAVQTNQKLQAHFYHFVITNHVRYKDLNR